MSNHIIIEVPAGRLNLFHEDAIRHIQRERSLETETRRSPYRAHLVCRAIELELKAKHLDGGKSRDDVKDQYGHKLQRSYDALPVVHQTLDKSEYQELCRASVDYDRKRFEYLLPTDVVTGFKNFPNLAVLRKIATKLVGEMTDAA